MPPRHFFSAARIGTVVFVGCGWMSLLCAQTPVAKATATPAATNAVPAKPEAGKASTNQPPAVKLSTVRALIGGIDYGTRATLQAGGDKFGFQTPVEWLIQNQAGASRILITHPEMLGNMALSYVPGSPAKELKFEDVRPALLEKYKGARLEGEYDGVAFGARALVFELNLSVGSEPWLVKILVIPVESGQIHASVVTPRESGATALSAFQQIVSSLKKADPDGVVRFPVPTENP